MKKVTMAWALGLGCALALGAAADEKTTKAHETGGSPMTATGCLEKGGEAKTYALTHVTSGTDWQLVDVPASLKLSDHVGHKVEISGTALAGGDKTADEKGVSSGTGSGARAPVAKPPAPEDKGVSSGTGSGAAKMKDKKEGRRLKVTSMKHVAATCP